MSLPLFRRGVQDNGLRALRGTMQAGSQADRYTFEELFVLGDSGIGRDAFLVGGVDSSSFTATADGVAIGIDADVSGGAGASIAIGASSTASANGAIAIGFSSTASADGSVAVGVQATSNAQSAVALGAEAEAGAADAVAVGDRSQASGTFAVAVGRQAVARGAPSIAVGPGSEALAARSAQIGGDGTVAADCARTLALGNRAEATGSQDSVVVGDDASIGGGDRCIAVGGSSSLPGDVDDRIALGRQATSSLPSSWTVGSNANRVTTWRIGPHGDVVLPIKTLTNGVFTDVFRIVYTDFEAVSLRIEEALFVVDGNDRQVNLVSVSAATQRDPMAADETASVIATGILAVTSGTLDHTVSPFGGFPDFLWSVRGTTSLAADPQVRVQIYNTSPTLDLVIEAL